MVVGLTGGIASGKSIVIQIFKFFGIEVYEADQRAKWLIQNDEEIRTGLIIIFGERVFESNGEYNTALVSKIVFSDDSKLQQLNQLIHPVVRLDYINWLSQVRSPYSIHEAALIIESGYLNLMDELILVTAPLDLRINWLMNRNHLSYKDALMRIESQSTDQEKLKHADHIIINDLKTGLIDQCLRIHHILLKECNG